MMEKMSFGIDVDRKLIENNVTALIAHAIADALGDKEVLVNSAVSKILESYVDERGNPCDKDKWRSKPYLQYLAEQCVEKTVRDEITKAVEENKEAFSEALKKELSRPQTRNSIAKSFLDAILQKAASEWVMPVTVTFAKPKD